MEKILLNIMKNYNLQPTKVYTLKDNKLECMYGFDNNIEILDKISNDEDFKALNLSIPKFCEKLFDLSEIRYSQENEFFID